MGSVVYESQMKVVLLKDLPALAGIKVTDDGAVLDCTDHCRADFYFRSEGPHEIRGRCNYRTGKVYSAWVQTKKIDHGFCNYTYPVFVRTLVSKRHDDE